MRFSQSSHSSWGMGGEATGGKSGQGEASRRAEIGWRLAEDGSPYLACAQIREGRSLLRPSAREVPGYGGRNKLRPSRRERCRCANGYTIFRFFREPPYEKARHLLY